MSLAGILWNPREFSGPGTTLRHFKRTNQPFPILTWRGGGVTFSRAPSADPPAACERKATPPTRCKWRCYSGVLQNSAPRENAACETRPPGVGGRGDLARYVGHAPPAPKNVANWQTQF